MITTIQLKGMPEKERELIFKNATLLSAKYFCEDEYFAEFVATKALFLFKKGFDGSSSGRDYNVAVDWKSIYICFLGYGSFKILKEKDEIQIHVDEENSDFQEYIESKFGHNLVRHKYTNSIEQISSGVSGILDIQEIVLKTSKFYSQDHIMNNHISWIVAFNLWKNVEEICIREDDFEIYISNYYSVEVTLDLNNYSVTFTLDWFPEEYTCDLYLKDNQNTRVDELRRYLK